MVFFKEKQKLKKTSFILVSGLAALSSSIFLFTFLEYVGMVDFPVSEKLNYTIFRISEITSFYFSYMLITGYFLQLEIKVTDIGINYKLKPFVYKTRTIHKDLVNSYEVLDNSGIKHYGGWNIRRGFGRMRDIYTVTGNIGVRIILADGKKIILGTQKPEMFIKGLERMKKHKLKKNG